MKRRNFIKGSAATVVAASTGNLLKAMDILPDGMEEAGEEGGPLIVSAPMLQNFAETSVGVAFAVSALANGYVLYGERPDLSDARKVLCGGYRLTEPRDRVVQVRLTGLKPSTTYYYRIGADRIHYGGGYDMKVLGTEEQPEIYHFMTAGKGTAARFCVINDTHNNGTSIPSVFEKVHALAPSCVIWNGDASNTEETVEHQVRIFLDPKTPRKDYAASTPYLLCPGNHDQRGWANRHLEQVWMFRQNEERAPRDWDLGRNFAVRLGDIALVGLDTGEDKQDTNPIFAGLFNNAAYREAQTLWLRDVLRRKDIARAPFLVVFCHIPLFDSRPDSNPGDIVPDDKDPRYRTDYAAWQRTCARLWGPLLEKAGCQVVITGHQHRYRYDASEPGRSWAQIVGGGPKMEERGFPTVIEGDIEAGLLRIRVHNILTGTVQDTFTFKKRR